MKDSTPGETFAPPAESKDVIVIGAADDFQTCVSKRLHRPDIYLNSAAHLSDGSIPFSTSNAAAMAAAVATLHLGIDTEKSRDAVLAALKPISRPAPVDPAVLYARRQEEERRRAANAASPVPYSEDPGRNEEFTPLPGLKDPSQIEPAPFYPQM